MSKTLNLLLLFLGFSCIYVGIAMSLQTFSDNKSNHSFLATPLEAKVNFYLDGSSSDSHKDFISSVENLNQSYDTANVTFGNEPAAPDPDIIDVTTRISRSSH